MQRGVYTYKEITTQDNSWAASLKYLNENPPVFTDWLQQSWEQVLFTGCGSTYYLSLSAAAIWQTLTKIPARAIPASDIWLYPESIISPKKTLLITVSRSAETSETIFALDTFKKLSKQDTLAITCYGDRELTEKARHSITAVNAHEQSIAQTRSFSTMLLLAQYISGIAARNEQYLEKLTHIPESFQNLILEYEKVALRIAEDDNLDHFIFLGSGIYYGLASEAMLKMKEMSLSTSEAFHFLEFRHGPKSMVTSRTLIAALLDDKARKQQMKVLKEMKDLGATILAIDEDGKSVPADFIVSINSGIKSIARGPLMLPILQLLAYHRSMHKGLNPDSPRNLDAVVVL